MSKANNFLASPTQFRRQKQLVKLQNGEYISLAKIETTLVTHPLVEMACVVANSLKNLPVSIIVPDMEKLSDLAPSIKGGVKEHSQSEEVRRAVLKALTGHLKDRGFERYEMPMAYCVVSDGPWTPETGLVTGAMKLRRRQIEARYCQEIENMYQPK